LKQGQIGFEGGAELIKDHPFVFADKVVASATVADRVTPRFLDQIRPDQKVLRFSS
jgi:hypothetical protein